MRSKIIKTEIGSEEKIFAPRSIRWYRRISVLRTGRLFPTAGIIFGVVFSYIFLVFSILYRKCSAKRPLPPGALRAILKQAKLGVGDKSNIFVESLISKCRLWYRKSSKRK